MQIDQSRAFARRIALGLTIAGAIMAAGCNDDNTDVDAGSDADSGSPTASAPSSNNDIMFASITPAVTNREKREVRATPTLSIVPVAQDGDSMSDSDDTTGSAQTYTAGYHTVLRSGDAFGAKKFGVLVANDGKAVLDEDGSQTVASSNDFSSLLRHGDQLFMVSHFESRPGAMYVTKLSQDSDSGQLSATDTTPIDFSQFGGLWVPCAGSVTPWGTHLGGEEYEPNARAVDASTGAIDAYYASMGAYITGSYATQDQGLTELNPYDYGYPTEISIISDAGDVDVAKHYAMGRKANELAFVMPDQKTVYNTDDGTNVGLYMYIADDAGDLSAGTLYAMKWNQTSAANGGAADLAWIDLGHATDEEVSDYLDKGLTFDDLFNTAEPINVGDATTASANYCPSGFTSINTNGYGLECLQVKPGMDQAASRLETRRYAALKGATTELRKEEGFTFDPNEGRFYVAISERERGMESNMQNGNETNKYDIGTSNDIRLLSNTCGTVYSGAVGSDDSIGSDYVAKNIQAEVSGTEVAMVEGDELPENTCELDGIANPDNITYMPGYNTLIIGEDSGTGHQNDMVWSYNTRTKDLTRIETTPYGSESTSIYFYPDYNGFAYLMSVVQHPYGESDSDKLKTADQARGYTGYIGPFPALPNRQASTTDSHTDADADQTVALVTPESS